MLPSFLRPLSAPPKHTGSLVQNAVFRHRKPLGQAHCLWWGQKDESKRPEIVILFIPGNPGLVEFYVPFLSALWAKDTTSRLAILAQGHLNHAPLPEPEFNASEYGLLAQVQSAIEAFDALRAEFGKQTKMVLIGHSVGAWIASQVLKARKADSLCAFLLFPTLSNIGTTPNGRWLSLFTGTLAGTALRCLLSSLGYVARLVPGTALTLLFRDWPASQLHVLRGLVTSPLAIDAALSMGLEEMKTIKDLDLALLEDCKDKLCFYYAEHDDWVGEEKNSVLDALHPHRESVSIVHDEVHGIPHAFCINHGEQLAEQCAVWLEHRRTLGNPVRY